MPPPASACRIRARLLSLLEAGSWAVPRSGPLAQVSVREELMANYLGAEADARAVVEQNTGGPGLPTRRYRR